MENQTIDEIAESCFAELNVSEDDEGTFDTSEYARDLDDLSDDSPGEQPEKTEAKTQDADEETPARQDNPDSQPAQQQPEQQAQPEKQPEQQAQPEKKAIPDLSRDEFTLLIEHDEADNTKYVQEYLLKKMEERDLSDFELGKLREIDNLDGNDLYGRYIESKTERKIMAKLKPVVDSHDQEQREEQQRRYFERENAIESSNKDEFGDELPALKQKVTDPKFIQEVLSQSPLADIVVREWREGSKAMSHKLLLRETQNYLAKKQATKRSKSVPADVGGSAAQRRTETASSIDEAFEAAERELS